MAVRGIGAVSREKRKEMAAELEERPFLWADLRNGMTRLERVIDFLEGLVLTQGKFKDQPFVLTPWQRELVEGIMECDPETGLRVIREVVLTIARKNAKSTTAAALALCWLIGPEAVSRGEIYCAAVDKDSASRLFNEMVAMIEADARLWALCDIKKHHKEIHTLAGPGAGSIYKTLSSDEAKAHGLNPLLVIGDEVAKWKGRDLYDALTTGDGVQEEPLFIFLSTKSANEQSPFAMLLRRVEQVKKGEIEDPTLLPIIFEVPEECEDIFDEEVWKLANPAIGHFYNIESIRKAAQKAKQSLSNEAVFRLLYLNQAIGDTTGYVAKLDWLACQGEIDRSKLRGRKCYMGLDLSWTRDLTALVLYFPDDGGAILPFFWMAKDLIEERSRDDHRDYQAWVDAGYIEATPGRTIDHRYVARKIAWAMREYQVEAVAYDPAGMAHFANVLTDEGVDAPMVSFRPGLISMSPAINATQAIILDRNLRHDGNPVLTDCIANSRVEIGDHVGNLRLTKRKSRGRIDGAMSMTIAIGEWFRRKPEDTSNLPFADLDLEDLLV